MVTKLTVLLEVTSFVLVEIYQRKGLFKGTSATRAGELLNLNRNQLRTRKKMLRGRCCLTFRHRIKSRLPFAGIIRRLYSTCFQDKG